MSVLLWKLSICVEDPIVWSKHKLHLHQWDFFNSVQGVSYKTVMIQICYISLLWLHHLAKSKLIFPRVRKDISPSYMPDQRITFYPYTQLFTESHVYFFVTEELSSLTLYKTSCFCGRRVNKKISKHFLTFSKNMKTIGLVQRILELVKIMSRNQSWKFSLTVKHILSLSNWRQVLWIEVTGMKAHCF